jgi:hypothetical protein
MAGAALYALPWPGAAGAAAAFFGGGTALPAARVVVGGVPEIALPASSSNAF